MKRQLASDQSYSWENFPINLVEEVFKNETVNNYFVEKIKSYLTVDKSNYEFFYQ